MLTDKDLKDIEDRGALDVEEHTPVNHFQAIVDRRNLLAHIKELTAENKELKKRVPFTLKEVAQMSGLEIDYPHKGRTSNER